MDAYTMPSVNQRSLAAGKSKIGRLRLKYFSLMKKNLIIKTLFDEEFIQKTERDN